MSRCLSLCLVISLFSLTACFGGGEGDKGTLVRTAVRTFLDKKDSSEVITTPPTTSAAMAMLDRPALNVAESVDEEEGADDAEAYPVASIARRETRVGIYIFKKPEIPTFVRRDKKTDEDKFYKLSILVLVVDGKVEMATVVSVGDPKRQAVNERTNTKVRGVVVTNGTYSVDWINENHVSKSFHRAPMKYAVFFNGGGIALHSTVEDSYAKLGQPASMGCVRMNMVSAKKVFETIVASGGADRHYPDVTIHVADQGLTTQFASEESIGEVFAALKQNFTDNYEYHNSVKVKP